MWLLLKLILAHLIGDFLFQPAKWVQAKEENKIKAYQLYLHALIHGGLIMLFVWDISFLKWALLLMLLHLAIDIAKLYLQKKETKRFYFFTDQFAHLISVFLVCFWYQGFSGIDFDYFRNERSLLLITITFFLTLPSSIIIRTFISKWPPDNLGDNLLAEAGKYIGIIERIFVFIFIITGHWEAIGFLLAAKSVFRFSDIKEGKDKKLTEYILIGTLVSFGIAILCGLFFISYPNKL